MKQTKKIGRSLSLFLLTALFTLLGLSQAKAQTTYNGQINANLTNVWLDGESETDRKTVSVSVDWSATWNTDKTITFTLSITPSNIVGLVPQIFLNGGRVADFSNGTYTTSDTYEQGETPDYALFMSYNGGASEQYKFNYTVGSSNSTGGGDSGSTGGGTDQPSTGNDATYYGQEEGNFTVDNTDYPYAFDWSATWNENKTVTITMVLATQVPDLATPQISINGGAPLTDFQVSYPKYTATTSETYEKGANQFGIRFPYRGNATVVALDYAAGDSNEQPAGWGNPTINNGDNGNQGSGDDDDDDDNNNNGDNGDDDDDDDDNNNNTGGDTNEGPTYTGKELTGTIADGTYAGTEVTVKWSATWNEDGTVTFSAIINPANMTGFTPQILGLTTDPVVLQNENGAWTYTTTEKYAKDDVIKASFLVAVELGATGQMEFTYTVGSTSNDSGNDTPSITPPTEGNLGNGETATGTIEGTFENAMMPGSTVVENIDFTLEWEATWNLDGTVTIDITIDPIVEGLVPQLNMGAGKYADFVKTDDGYTYTTEDVYKEGTSPFSFYLTYAGGSANIALDYEVGSSDSTDAIYRINGVQSSDSPVEYYNLNGVRVANPQHGIYIMRQGDKTRKIMIR